MFVAKPHKFGEPAELDGTDSQSEVQDLSVLAGAKLVPLQGPGMFAYPDGATAPVGTVRPFTVAPK